MFKQVGDVAVQYDPAHAALPWAGIRFLLQVCKIVLFREGVAEVSTDRCQRFQQTRVGDRGTCLDS
jgi:hypothetical protein